jgi:hypothetical protein
MRQVQVLQFVGRARLIAVDPMGHSRIKSGFRTVETNQAFQRFLRLPNQT